ncbi:MAG: hypothetical protein IJ773_05485 [Lachnospiraceae bacterium]|nr:hypothetical protein [Lachnospiraceae bacterium]
MNLSNVGLITVILLGVAILIVILVIYAYNRRLDRVANGEEHDTHSAIPEPGTTAGIGYKAVLLGLVIFMFFSIGELNSKIDSLRSAINNLEQRQQNLSSEMYRLRVMMEESEKNVSSTSWDVLDADLEAGTAKVRYQVVLKQYSDNTKVALRLNGQEIALPYQTAGIFSGEFTTGLFDEYTGAAVLMTENGITTAEETYFSENLFRDCLPMPSLGLNMSAETRNGKTEYEGNYQIFVKNLDLMKTVKLTYLSGGRELKSIDVTEDVRRQSWTQLEKGLDVGDEGLLFLIEVTTTNGFTILEQTPVFGGENAAEQEYAYYQEILDAEGNSVWKSPEKW